MFYLVFSEMIPEALERGEDLEGGGRKALGVGLTMGFLSMLPLLFI